MFLGQKGERLLSILAIKYIVNEQGMIVEEIEETEVNESERKVNPPYDDIKNEIEEDIVRYRIN